MSGDAALDSSVMAKWALPEDDSALARRVVDETTACADRVVVLELALIEATNAIVTRWRRASASASRLTKSCTPPCGRTFPRSFCCAIGRLRRPLDAMKLLGCRNCGTRYNGLRCRKCGRCQPIVGAVIYMVPMLLVVVIVGLFADDGVPRVTQRPDGTKLYEFEDAAAAYGLPIIVGTGVVWLFVAGFIVVRLQYGAPQPARAIVLPFTAPKIVAVPARLALSVVQLVLRGTWWVLVGLMLLVLLGALLLFTVVEPKTGFYRLVVRRADVQCIAAHRQWTLPKAGVQDAALHFEPGNPDDATGVRVRVFL